MMGNKGSYTVITGASSGLGYEAVKAFAGRGSNLILAARRKDRMEGLRREILEEHPALDVAVKAVDREDFSFVLCEPRFPYAGESQRNQKRELFN